LATLRSPFVSILNGPKVTAETSVFDVVTAAPFKVSFVVTLPPIDAKMLPLTIKLIKNTDTADVHPAALL
jgi:hypothetical protein